MEGTGECSIKKEDLRVRKLSLILKLLVCKRKRRDEHSKKRKEDLLVRQLSLIIKLLVTGKKGNMKNICACERATL